MEKKMEKEQILRLMQLTKNVPFVAVLIAFAKGRHVSFLLTVSTSD